MYTSIGYTGVKSKAKSGPDGQLSSASHFGPCSTTGDVQMQEDKSISATKYS